MYDSQRDYVVSVNKGKDLSTEVYIFKIDRISEIVNSFFTGFESIFIVDSKIKLYHNERIPERNILALPVYVSEKSKSLDKVYELYSYFYQNLSFNTIVIGVGGGSLLDLVGFTVKTISGNIPLLFIPTTLSSMLSPFIRGEFLINFDRKKDFLSVKGLPNIMILDPSFVKTQGAYSLALDCLSAISTGLTCEASFYHFVENIISLGVTNWSYDLFKELLVQNIQLRIKSSKNVFVGEKMADIIQTASNLMIRYSKALGLGIIIESNIAMNHGFLEEKVYKEIKRTVSSILKLEKLPIDLQSLYQTLRYQKSGNFSAVKIPILVKPGQTVEISISAESVVETVKQLFFEGLHPL